MCRWHNTWLSIWNSYEICNSNRNCSHFLKRYLMRFRLVYLKSCYGNQSSYWYENLHITQQNSSKIFQNDINNYGGKSGQPAEQIASYIKVVRIVKLLLSHSSIYQICHLDFESMNTQQKTRFTTLSCSILSRFASIR